jgi:hypothetical protein
LNLKGTHMITCFMALVVHLSNPSAVAPNGICVDPDAAAVRPSATVVQVDTVPAGTATWYTR